jgi:hypothetical protein
MVWTTKGTKSLPLLMLHSVYKQGVLLQKTQIAFISKQDVTGRVHLGLESYWVYIPSR